MRLTYRTLRVLAAIAAQPGLSNKQVGELAGVKDAGQTSKLLARLARLGVIENSRRRPRGRGDVNAWTLTGTGRAILRAGRRAKAILSRV